MAFKKLHAVVAVVGIALLGGAAWWMQNRPAGLTLAGADRAGSAATGAGAMAGAGGSARGAAGANGPGPGGAGGAGGAGGPVAVEVGKVESTRLLDDAQAVGSVRARQSVVLRPEVSGRILRLGFQDGQRVRKGQVLVQLDDTLQQAQVKQALAQASIARSNWQRSQELAAQNFVAKSAVDQNAAALEVAQAQVALAQAQVSRMRVLAPFDAVAGIRSANVGDYVKDGADIVTLEDSAAVWVDFRLPERFAARVKSDQTVSAEFDALPGKVFKGQVAALDSALDANGRAILVRARLDNPGGQLRAGMFARVQLVFGSRENALLVPEEALVPLGGRQYIFKVQDGPNGSKVSQKIEAKLGLRQPGRAEILEGLKAGDLVVTAGHGRLTRGDSMPVRVVDIDKPAAARGGRPGASAPAGASPPPAGVGSAPAGAVSPPAGGGSAARGALPAAAPV